MEISSDSHPLLSGLASQEERPRISEALGILESQLEEIKKSETPSEWQKELVIGDWDINEDESRQNNRSKNLSSLMKISKLQDLNPFKYKTEKPKRKSLIRQFTTKEQRSIRKSGEFRFPLFQIQKTLKILDNPSHKEVSSDSPESSSEENEEEKKENKRNSPPFGVDSKLRNYCFFKSDEPKASKAVGFGFKF